MIDNLTPSVTAVKSSLAAFRRKITNLKTMVDELSGEIDRFDIRLDKVISNADVYKSKAERHYAKENKALATEVEALRKQVDKLNKGILPSEPQIPELELEIATTMSIFECLLRCICGNDEDFRLISYSFLFPAVFERVIQGDEPDYFFSEMPDASEIVVKQGREYLQWVRSICDTHLTDPDSWDLFVDDVAKWWKNNALPLLYGTRDDQWDTDEALTLKEMLMWHSEPAERPMNFPTLFDGYDIYRKHKDQVFTSSGVREFEVKTFSYAQG